MQNFFGNLRGDRLIKDIVNVMTAVLPTKIFLSNKAAGICLPINFVAQRFSP